MSFTGKSPLESNRDSSSEETLPWVGVHVLTEFMYCRRAGLIAFEQGDVDRGEDLWRAPRLDYLPDYDLQLIEEALQTTWEKIGRLLRWGGILLFGLALSVWWLQLRAWIVLLIAAFWLLRKLTHLLRDILELSRRRKSALTAQPQIPDFNADQSQSVNWWGLLKAGLEPIEYEDPHQDRQLQLAGRPWRVLHYGSLRIPVFRKRHGESRLRPQHLVRMAAYSHLIEVAEGATSPCGIVLFSGGYEGQTVPILPEHQQQFRNELERTRDFLRKFQQQRQDPSAPQQRVCENCPIGRPRVYRPGETDTILSQGELRPFLTRGVDDREYHSPCGDRFEWVPPHARAFDKKLL